MKEIPLTTFISVAVFAPLFEEVLCRGIILRGLLHYYSPWKAILLSAAATPIIRIIIMLGFLVSLIYGGILTVDKQIEPER